MSYVDPKPSRSAKRWDSGEAATYFNFNLTVMDAHMVANGASELLIEVFEEREAHARSALGVSQISFGCCVEIEMVVETFVSENTEGNS